MAGLGTLDAMTERAGIKTSGSRNPSDIPLPLARRVYQAKRGSEVELAGVTCASPSSNAAELRLTQVLNVLSPRTPASVGCG